MLLDFLSVILALSFLTPPYFFFLSREKGKDCMPIGLCKEQFYRCR